ncbi:MAG TPA: YhjD/YihY/BrkB family envelope integrity protein [Acidimicrobiales bacterium]|nr:YhjD/YihY/BrkB family envelope integrity protein [Acidimicrobiales bacterium]
MDRVKRWMERANRWQRHHAWFAVPWAVIKKFGTDQANLLVVALGWYGFTAIYPLLLIVVTVFGYIGVSSLGSSIVSTLHQFPVIGQQFQPGHGSSTLHGSAVGLVIGVVGLLYGAQGVTQTAQTAMNRVWNVPQVERPGFLPRLWRSLAGLACIGSAFLVNAFLGSLATAGGRDVGVRIGLIVAQLAINVVLYLGAFRVLLAARAEVPTKQLVPGAVTGAVFFTALITVGTGLIEHELKGESATYGAFASVIGVVTFLLLLAKLSLYAAELNPVLLRRLYPRALPLTDPLPADRQVFEDLAHEEKRRHDERIGVGFDPDAAQEAYEDVDRDDDPRDRTKGAAAGAGHGDHGAAGGR